MESEEPAPPFGTFKQAQKVKADTPEAQLDMFL